MTRSEWLLGVAWLLEHLTAAQRETMRRRRVTASLMMRWARAKTAYACGSTGRRCVVRPATLASVMESSPGTVKNCNHIARMLGIETVVSQGRMLTITERHAAQQTGSRQRGLSSEVALTLPRHVLVDVAADRVCGEQVSVDTQTPSRGQAFTPKSSRNSLLSDAVDSAADTTEPPPAAPPTKKVTDRPVKRRDSRATHLAFALHHRIPWLRTEQPGRTAPALARFAAAEWTAPDVLDAVQHAAQRLGRPNPLTLAVEAVRTRPAALLAHLLRPLDPVADWPGHTRAFTDTPMAAEPCGHDDCDGHGWINTTLPSGHQAAKPCPHCPPEIRHTDTDPWNVTDPPF